MAGHVLAPDDVVATHAEGAANDRVPLLVTEPLLAFLDAHGLGAGAGLEVEPVGEGHSNVTFVVRRGGWEGVLRRPPRPPIPPSAHDVLREARVLTALAPSAVRAPRVLAVCPDEAVIGAPFYVMERVAGEVITSSLPAAFDAPGARRRIGEELVDALVELHAADWRALGLEGFGKPTGYLERQVRRFLGLWEHNRTRDIEAVERVGRWLGEHLPDSPTATIVHGDFRLGNTMFAAQAAAAARRDLRLGDGDDRRPAGRRRLPLHDVAGGRRPAARDVRPRHGHPPAGVPHARRARRALRGGLGAIDDRRALVHDARPVEGGRVHGGQLQARGRRRDGRPVPARRSATASWSSRRSPTAPRTATTVADAPPARPAGPRRGLLVDWGGVLTTSVFASFAAFCADEGLAADRVAAAFRHDPEGRRLLEELETGALTEADFERPFGALLGLAEDRAPGLVDRLFGGMRAEPALPRGGPPSAGGGRPHRPDLELVGRGPL